MATNGPAYRTADATVSAYDAAEVTLSDSADIKPTRALYIGTAGDLKVTLTYNNTVTFSSVQAGTILPVQATRVWRTGSTASSVVALY